MIVPKNGLDYIKTSNHRVISVYRVICGSIFLQRSLKRWIPCIRLLYPVGKEYPGSGGALETFKTISIVCYVRNADTEGGMSFSVEPSSVEKSGLDLLEETMASLGEFVSAADTLVHVALDEFQEIVVLKEALQIEGAMRTHMHQSQASYFFIGSRRRVLLGIFNERQRPFFRSAINYPLKSLPPEDLVQFIAGQFRENNKKCSERLHC